MALQLFEVEGGLSDGRIYYISGTAAPAIEADAQVIINLNGAPVGSQYVDSSTGIVYKKTQDTASPAADYSVAVSTAPDDRLIKEINQTTHGFIVGDWLRFDISGIMVKALADDADNADVIGVVNIVTDTDNFTMVTRGYTDVAFTADDGTALFLDQATAGAATTVKPNTGVQKNLGFVVGNTVYIGVDITIDISSDEAPSVPLIIVDGITTITTIDSALVDDYFSIVWEIVASDDTNAKREAYLVQVTHDGTTTTDATTIKHNRFSWLKPAGQITGLAFGVILTGSGAAQQLELTCTASNTVEVRMRRIAA